MLVDCSHRGQLNVEAMSPGRSAVGPAGPRAAVELQLLGGFTLLASDGTPIDLPTRKCRLLLAYLASPPGQAHAREKLASLFWPDAQPDQARASLRHALAAMRNALEPLAIEATHDRVVLAPGRLRIDVEALARAARERVADLQNVGHLYRGQFLEGESLNNPDFDDWLTFERTRCRNLAQSAFEHAIADLGGRGMTKDAVMLAQSLVSLDPLREQSHRLLMQTFEAAGERSQALEQYRRLVDLLKNELSVDPSPQSIALAKAMRARPGPEETQVSTPGEKPSTTEPLAGGAALTPPGPISIVVLPFASLSEGSDDQLAARGFSEDLITQLSRLPELFVIARQTSDLFPSAAATASAAASDLGVRYAVSGTYRRSADRLRITVQLTDASTNRCVWAERYDSEVAETFVMQDEIIFDVSGALDANIRFAERERGARLEGKDFGAWEMAHRGLWYLQRFKRTEFDNGQKWLERSIELSPRFSVPHAGLAYIAYARTAWGLADDFPAAMARAIDHGRKAIELDPKSAFAWTVMGRVLMLTGKLREALDHHRRALELNPSFAHAYLGLAQAHLWAGEYQQALPLLDLVQRLSPRDPLLSTILNFKAFSQFGLGDFSAAEATARRSIQADPTDRWSRLGLAVALIGQGRIEEARQALASALAIDGTLSAAHIRDFVRHVAPGLRDAVLDALREAGLPQ